MELLQRLSFGYGVEDTSVSVMDDVSLTIRPEKVTVLMGPNGCGKSTVVHLLLGEVRATSALALRALDDEERAAAVLQDYRAQVILGSSLLVNVDLLLGRRRGIRLPEDPYAQVKDRLASFGYDIDLTRTAATLSGGQLQAFVLARSLIFHRGLWVLDEPASAIDFRRRTKIFGAIRKRHIQGRTVLMVTHDFEDALSLADDILLFDPGMVLLTAIRVNRRPGETAQQFLLSPVAQALREEYLRVVHGNGAVAS